MNLDIPSSYIFVTVGIVVAFLIIRGVRKYGGYRGMMFGARIRRTVGEVAGGDRSFMKTALKVHALDAAPEKAVALELVAKGIGSYQMMPFVLSVDEAGKLIAHLQAAIDAR